MFTAHHFYQRQQVHRVEWVTDHAALRVGGALIELTGQQARGAGADQRIGLGRGTDLTVQLQFQFQAFRGAFLDEVGVLHALLDGRHKPQAVLAGARCQALFFQGAPGIGDTFAQGRFGAWRRVPGHHIQAVG